MNKEEILKHLKINNPEQTPKIKRIIDLANHVNKSHDLQYTGFLSPDLIAYIPRIMFHYQDLNYKLEGGLEDAEYVRLIIYPDYLFELETVIAIIDLKYDIKYGEIGHRDVLGAVLSLGIKRDLIGDIIIEPGHVQIMASKEMSEYICDQIRKIGRVTVVSEIVSNDALIVNEDKYRLLNETVKSLRLDSIISKGFNMSRSKASDLVKGEQVKVNHNFTTQNSKEVEENTLISVRGQGRIRLESIHGLSKKDRYKITIKKYI